MLGTIINVLAISVGSIIGLSFRGVIPRKQSDTLMHVMALAVILIGLKGAWKTENFPLVTFCLAVGCLIGEFIKIEKVLNSLGGRLEERFSSSGESLSKGFVTASLLFCVGSMAIIGSLESGFSGNHDILFAKSIIDGIISIVLSATLGMGVIFSALSVFLYQGLITLSASFLKQFLTNEIITQMSAVGGLVIVAMGFNMLEITKIRVGNILPAIFLPSLYFILRDIVSAF